jgi:hypothetical protein
MAAKVNYVNAMKNLRPVLAGAATLMMVAEKDNMKLLEHAVDVGAMMLIFDKMASRLEEATKALQQAERCLRELRYDPSQTALVQVTQEAVTNAREELGIEAIGVAS